MIIRTFLRFSLVCALALVFTVSSAHAERKKYVAKNSTEAILRFSFQVTYPAAADDIRTAMHFIEQQVRHLYGPMGEARYLAVPKADHRISVTKIERDWRWTTRQVYTATYNYEGTIALENGPTDTYEVALPYFPTNVYSSGAVGGRYPCTDPHYQSEGDFWYFWNPSKAGCPLEEGKDYENVRASVERIENTELSYPEYARLVRNVGGKRVIRIDALFGLDKAKNYRDPYKTGTKRDINASNYVNLVSWLKRKGYVVSKKWSQEEVDALLANKNEGYGKVTVEDLTLEADNGVTIVVRMFFGPSGLSEDSLPFHYFVKDAMETSSVFIYSGHSGLGGNLNLPYMEQKRGFRVQPDQSNYQLYFINGCTTYSYYNDYFFERKKSATDMAGTKNLDVITNGLATYFSVIDDTDYYLIDAITEWAQGGRVFSYQELADISDTNNLYGVNGDEDNPTDAADPAVGE